MEMPVNSIYGVLHAGSIPIIQGNPVRVVGTQEAVQRTGAPGSVAGILPLSGTYSLIRARQSPPLDQSKGLTLTEGRVAPAKTELDAATGTLKDATCVAFDVEVTPATLVAGPAKNRDEATGSSAEVGALARGS